MNRRLFITVWTIIGLFLISGVAFAAAPFYEGKTIRIIVGYSAGGGYDMYCQSSVTAYGQAHSWESDLSSLRT